MIWEYGIARYVIYALLTYVLRITLFCVLAGRVDKARFLCIIY
jgi:hypothetical protein